jgi:hypothetical protein
MKQLVDGLFLVAPKRLGRLGFAIARRGSFYWNRYDAYNWTSWEWAGVRIYWHAAAVKSN